MLDLLVVTTGGSIDKTYSSLASDFVCAAPVCKALLREVKCAHKTTFVEICRKDSLELTDGDRDAVVAAVAATPKTHILVTHGTDTLWKTALAVKPVALKAGKVVALTGSMRPAAFKATDAHFNIGGAVAALPYLPPGAHIIMNGRVFSEPDRVIKDYDRDVFHEGDLEPSKRAALPGGMAAAPKKARAKSRESVVVEGTLGLTDAEFEAQVLSKKPEADAPTVERGSRGRGGKSRGRGRGGKRGGQKGSPEAVPEPAAAE